MVIPHNRFRVLGTGYYRGIVGTVGRAERVRVVQVVGRTTHCIKRRGCMATPENHGASMVQVSKRVLQFARDVTRFSVFMATWQRVLSLCFGTSFVGRRHDLTGANGSARARARLGCCHRAAPPTPRRCSGRPGRWRLEEPFGSSWMDGDGFGGWKTA